MNRKFITIWLLMVLCTAEPTRITLTDPKKDQIFPFKISPKLHPVKGSYADIDTLICPVSLPVVCTQKNTILPTDRKQSLCLSEKDFPSWNKDTSQEFIIENDRVFSRGKNTVATCQLTKQLLDLTRDEFLLLNDFQYSYHQKDPHEAKHDGYQCILIGHQYESSVEEVLYYNVTRDLNHISKDIENKTGFQKFDRLGQIHYDFFSCSTTQEGIMNAKKWYENHQKPWYQIWNSNFIKHIYSKSWLSIH